MVKLIKTVVELKLCINFGIGFFFIQTEELFI
jgi:hypothetical protein